MAVETNLSNLHKLFIEELNSKGRSNSTLLAYGKDIEQLIEFLKGHNLTDINKVTFDNLDAFKKELNKKSFTNKSISRKINSIRTFYKFLNDKKFIKENISVRLEHPKFETNPPRTLTEIEYRALRDTCRHDARLFAIVEILLQTGIRIGELTRLSVSDLQLGNNTNPKMMTVNKFGSHPERKIPLNRSALDSLSVYMRNRPKGSDSLFVTKTGKPLLVRNVRTSIDRAFKKAGIKNAKVNDLRNTFIAHHLAKGTSLVIISKLVGHKRISTTEKYLGLIELGDTSDIQLEEL